MCVIQNCAWATYNQICLGSNTFQHEVTVNALPAGGTYQLRGFPPASNGPLLIDNITAPGVYTSTVQGNFVSNGIKAYLTNNAGCQLSFTEQYYNGCYNSSEPPGNDFCPTAYPLELGDGQCGQATQSGTQQATLTLTTAEQGQITAAGGSLGPDAREVWYATQNTATTDRDITLEFTGSDPDYYFVVFENDCGNRTLIAVGQPGQNLTLPNVDAGTQLRIALITTTDPATGDEFVDLCGRSDAPANPAPANDDLANAEDLPTGTGCPGTSGTTAFADAGTYANAVCAFTAPGQGDVWYRVYPSQGTLDLRFTVSAGDVDAQLLYGSDPTQLIEYDCYELDRILLINLPTAAYWYLRVTDGNIANNQSTAVYQLCAPAATDLTGADACADATVLIPGTAATCSTGGATRGTTAGATESLPPGNSFIPGPANDVWYAFTALTDQITLRVTNVEIVNNPIQNDAVQIDLYTGNCGSLSPVNQFTANNATLVGLQVGDTYYLRLYSFFGGDLDFDICIERPDPPANDECANATLLAVQPGTDCGGNATSDNTSNATASAPATVCAGSADEDVWYRFVATAPRLRVAVSNRTKVGGNFGGTDLNLEYFSGACGSLTPQGCDVNGLLLNNLQANQEYYVRAFAVDDGVYLSYDLCVHELPANDDCGDAISLTPSSSPDCVNPVAGSLAGATPTTLPGCPPGSAITEDVFYTFTAIANVHTFAVSATSGDLYGIGVRSGGCTAAESACGYETLTVTGLTVGQTITVRIFAEDYHNAGAFTLCVGVPPPPPGNDLPAGATLLSYEPLCGAGTAGTVEAATESATAACNSAFPSATLDVWYRFVAPQASVEVAVMPEGFGSFVVELLDGTDPGQDILDCAVDVSFDGATTLSATALTPGQPYYLRVYDQYGFPATGVDAAFRICLHGLPTVLIPDSFGSCQSANSVTSTGSNQWLYLLDNGQLLMGILDSEAMGTVSGTFRSDFYDPPRSNANGLEAMDRNFTATPATQPANPVRVRLFITAAEYQRFIQNQDGDGNDANDLNDLVVYRYGNVACGSTVPTGGVVHTPLASGLLGNVGYYVEIEIPGFSAFFLSGNGAALPVTYAGFGAERHSDGSVALDWITLQERHSAHFDVERSTDGRSFAPVGRVAAAGYSDVRLDYAFMDADAPRDRTLYYRLHQVDHDGAGYFSSTVAVRYAAGQVPVRVFPNPVAATLHLDGLKAGDRVEVYDALGQLVHRATAQEVVLALPTDDWAPGVYTVRVLGAAGTVRTVERVVRE